MSFALQCNLTLQDCASLYPSRDLAFSDRSCVPDIRMGENIGRCGFSGAPCVVSGIYSNCGSEDDLVCRGGFCVGPGDSCTAYRQCNYAIWCNVTSGTSGVCGGAGAVVYNYTGIDFGRDYCASGSAVQNATSMYGWSCAPGPFLVLPSPIPAPPPTSIPSANPSTMPSPSTPIPNESYPSSTPSPSAPSANGSRPSTPVGAIIGGTVSGLVAFALVAALLLRQRRQRNKKTNYIVSETDALRHPTSAGNDGPTNVHKSDVEDAPSPSPAAYAARTTDMRTSTSHAGARIITHPPADSPIPLEQSTSEIAEVTRAAPPLIISGDPPATPEYETQLSPSQLAVVRRLAEQNVTGPTLAAVINSLIGEAEGGAGQINQPGQRTTSSPPDPEDPPPQYDWASP